MTEFISAFHFIRPAALWLLPVVAALWWGLRRWQDPMRGWRAQMNSDLLAVLVIGRSARRLDHSTLTFLASVLGVVAIAGPTWRPEPSPFADDASPLLILLKADISMDTTDVAPTRLERAKLKIADIAAERKGQPLGLIAYSGSAHLVLPPTRDTAAVVQLAAEVSAEIMPVAGDRLDLALREAGRVLTVDDNGPNQRAGREGSVVVIADSVDADPDVIRAAQQAAAIPIQFLEIVSAESAEDGSSINSLARAIGATSTPFTVDGGDVTEIVDRAAQTPMLRQGEQAGRWQEAGYWLVPGLALLVLSLFQREVRDGEEDRVT